MAPGLGTPLTVSFVAPPDGFSAWVRLVGDVDMAGEPALAEATDRLAGLTVRFVIIDVAAVTFACSTLANFLDAVHDAHPDAVLELRHASSMVRRIVRVTGVDRFVAVSGDCGPPAPSRAGDLQRQLRTGIADHSVASSAAGPPAPSMLP